MEDALQRIAHWVSSGESLTAVGAPTLVALSFFGFNAMRIVLHVPQLLTCLRDDGNCAAINLLTWCSWIAASTSNALYMGLVLGDAWGLGLNLGNAAMCAATGCVTCIKRRRHARRTRDGVGPFTTRSCATPYCTR